MGTLRMVCLLLPYRWGEAKWCTAVGIVKSSCLWAPGACPFVLRASYWGPTSSSNTPRYYPSHYKYSMWTIVTARNPYHWSSLSTRPAT